MPGIIRPSGRSIQKPYDDGEKDYNSDYYNRYTSGELFVKDSVQFDEELSYKTTNGRTVYGGGGIMPDYFVALDTADISAYVNRLSSSNTIREYTLDYRDNHSELKEMSFEDYQANFEVSSEMLKELVLLGNKNNVRYSKRQFDKSRNLLSYLVKARIARDLYDDDAFYKIYNETNEIYRQAIALFRNPDLLQNQSNGVLLQTR